MATYRSLHEAYRSAGFGIAEYFDHEVVELGKMYPDARLALERRGFPTQVIDGGRYFQVNVYADDVREFPIDLFFDDRVNWHRQQFGRPGLVGAAGVVLENDELASVTLIQSDLLQQIFRAPEFHTCRSRLKNRYRAWAPIVIQSLVHCLARRGIRWLDIPTADTITRLTKKRVDPELFHRVYDRATARFSARHHDRYGFGYHRIDVTSQATHCYETAASHRERPERVQICVLHDIEQDVDTNIAPELCRRHLARMLDIEAEHGIQGTYHVLGTMFDEVAPAILDRGHAIGFHSYDHDPRGESHLPRVRGVNLQAKGYRPPQSRLTDELCPKNLTYWNFEWLAVSAHALGQNLPFVDGYIAHVPIDMDDYVLQTGESTFEQWRNRLLSHVPATGLFAFSLHDCYAAHWIDHYDRLLDDLAERGTFATCDDVAADLFRAAADVASQRPARPVDRLPDKRNGQDPSAIESDG